MSISSVKTTPFIGLVPDLTQNEGNRWQWHKIYCSDADVLTVICENVPTDALIDHVAFGKCLIPFPLSSTGAVLCDQTGYGSLVQHISWRPLWPREETYLHLIRSLSL